MNFHSEQTHCPRPTSDVGENTQLDTTSLSAFTNTLLIKKKKSKHNQLHLRDKSGHIHVFRRIVLLFLAISPLPIVAITTENKTTPAQNKTKK